MNFTLWLNSMRFLGGILIAIAASQSCSLAKAQELKPRALSAIDPVSDPTVRATGQQKTTAPVIANYWDDCLEDCCRTSWNCSSSSCGDPCSCIYGQVQSLFLVRESQFANQAIVVDTFPGPNTTFLSTSAVDSSTFTPGVQATFGMCLCDGRALEFEYFGLFPNDESAVVAGLAGGVFPGNLGVGVNVFDNIARAQVDYSSWINGFSMNFPCCCGCYEECCNECCCCQVGNESDNREVRTQSLTWFAGFRYLNVGERLNITADSVTPGEQGTYNTRTTNNLYGAQLGARMRRTQGRFGWDASGQAGLFGNDAQQSQLVQDFPAGSPALRNESTSRGGVAFVGQGNISGLYALTNVWNLRAGYNVIWIEGLALAPDQLDFNFATAGSGTRVNNDGGLFLHGVNIGLEARW
ncbi:MAG: BBP7 family outer membrane beta-barrel protein [Planctomycetaceae bacterium]